MEKESAFAFRDGQVQISVEWSSLKPMLQINHVTGIIAEGSARGFFYANSRQETKCTF